MQDGSSAKDPARGEQVSSVGGLAGATDEQHGGVMADIKQAAKWLDAKGWEHEFSKR